MRTVRALDQFLTHWLLRGKHEVNISSKPVALSQACVCYSNDGKLSAWFECQRSLFAITLTCCDRMA